MTFIAAIFNITPAAVPAKGELPHESEPAQIEQRVHDRADGVDGSVFYISRPRADALTPVYAADFGIHGGGQRLPLKSGLTAHNSEG